MSQHSKSVYRALGAMCLVIAAVCGFGAYHFIWQEYHLGRAAMCFVAAVVFCLAAYLLEWLSQGIP